MTARTATRTPARIPASTTAGLGLVLPLAKMMAHMMVLRSFIAPEYETTVTMQMAANEWREVSAHLTDIRHVDDLLTDETVVEIEAWQANITQWNNDLTVAARATPEEPFSEYADMLALQDFIENAWSIFTQLDRELTGLSERDSDPGSRP